MLAAAQAIEQYEISRYGTLKSWAAKLGTDRVVLPDSGGRKENRTKR
jgi:ferritin-like metal-binding protein YciE